MHFFNCRPGFPTPLQDTDWKILFMRNLIFEFYPSINTDFPYPERQRPELFSFPESRLWDFLRSPSAVMVIRQALRKVKLENDALLTETNYHLQYAQGLTLECCIVKQHKQTTQPQTLLE